MKLKEEEIKVLFDIVNDYQDIFSNLTNIEEELSKLNSKQLELKKLLEDNRKKEKEFTDYIVTNYGKGKFNPETLEYELI